MLVITQFLSSLADNALLIVAIGLLMERGSAPWMAPALRIFFYAAYLLLAPVAGSLADAFPKGRVLSAMGFVKLIGCGLLIAQVHPLVAYVLVGFGAAAYAPAKYGILPELLEPDQLVAGNAWIEVTTVLSILLGVAVGSLLMTPGAASIGSAATSPAIVAAQCIAAVYALAALCALLIRPPHWLQRAVPDASARPVESFLKAQRLLWRDREGALSLSVTSLFWAVAAVLQFLVLRWSQDVFALSLAHAALLQLPVALGMVAGAVAAGRWISLTSVPSLPPIGIAMGGLVLLMALVTHLWLAIIVLAAVGILAGLLLVPMNALLQHRGHALMPAGQSIAIQNFSENLASVSLLSGYGLMVYLDLPARAAIVGIGMLLLGAMAVLGFLRRDRADHFSRNKQLVTTPVPVPLRQSSRFNERRNPGRGQ